MTTRKKNYKKYKHLETKDYDTKQPMGHWRSQKKKPGNKWKWKHNDPKSKKHSESSSKKKVYSDTGLPQETEKYQINNQPHT